jgi:hypothetical protein
MEHRVAMQSNLWCAFYEYASMKPPLCALHGWINKSMPLKTSITGRDTISSLTAIGNP